MNHLTSEMVEEIFLRVPTKSLARCKCVSKSWLHIIEDPSFAKIQFSEDQHHSESELLFICSTFNPSLRPRVVPCKETDDDTNIFKFGTVAELDEDLMVEYISIHGSDKGFVCLCNCMGAIPDYLADCQNYIYNPITKERVQLPKFIFPDYRKTIDTGFGYVDFTNEFKLLHVMSGGSEFCEAKVHTLGSPNWRTIECPFFFDTIRSTAKLIKGFLHWANVCIEYDTIGIVAFNLKNEQFSYVPVPQNIVLKDRNKIELGVLGGCLSISDFDFEDRVEILVMQEHNVKESWTILFSVNTKAVGKMPFAVRPILVRKNGEIVLFYNEEHLLSYNSENEECRYLDSGPLQLSNKCFSLQICSYAASPFRVSQYMEWREAQLLKTQLTKD